MLNSDLISTDFLVYSSHKTGTQTIAHTLRMNGFRCLHCHRLRDGTTQVAAGEFKTILRLHAERTETKLRIVSVFRKPLERHVSSFFQWYGDGVLRKKMVATAADTIIMRLPVAQLQATFIEQLGAGELPGTSESLDELCAELDVPVSRLNFDPARGHGITELPLCRVALFRFESLMQGGGLESQLPVITGKDIVRYDANKTDDKWYRDIYARFRETLQLPPRLVTDAYESRRHLVDLFYPGQYDALLAEALRQYCEA